MNAAEVLSKARDVLAEKGWCQGRLVDEGAVCLAGGVKVAAGFHLDDIHWLDAPVMRGVFVALAAAIGSDSVVTWNDDPSRTYEDVVLALKQAEELAVERGL